MPQNISSRVLGLRRKLEYDAVITQLYFRHTASIFNLYDRWKNIDEYYFIELKLYMVYVTFSKIINVANPPYHLGTIVRNSITYPQLLSYKCSKGRRAYAYAYNGSPESKVLNLSLACPTFGWKGSIDTKSWIKTSYAMKLTRAEDFSRLYRIKKENTGFMAADLRDLLRMLGVPEQDLVLPRIEHKSLAKKANV